MEVMTGSFVPAVSTGRCNTGFKFLCLGLVLQGLSGSFIELACDCAEFGDRTIHSVLWGRRGLACRQFSSSPTNVSGKAPAAFSHAPSMSLPSCETFGGACDAVLCRFTGFGIFSSCKHRCTSWYQHVQPMGVKAHTQRSAEHAASIWLRVPP
jgi:hypothetical protein